MYFLHVTLPVTYQRLNSDNLPISGRLHHRAVYRLLRQSNSNSSCLILEIAIIEFVWRAFVIEFRQANFTEMIRSAKIESIWSDLGERLSFANRKVLFGRHNADTRDTPFPESMKDRSLIDENRRGSAISQRTISSYFKPFSLLKRFHFLKAF